MNQDIRQSQNWADYLNYWGWNSYKTENNTNIEILHKFRSNTAKVQRPNDLNEEELNKIESICKEIKCFQLKIEPKLEQDALLLEDTGYLKSNTPLTPSRTIFIDLIKKEQALWKDVSSGGKYSINNAKKNNMKLKFSIFPKKQEANAFHEIYRKSAKHNKTYAFPVDAILQEIGIFKEQSYIGFAKDQEDNLHSTALFLGHGNTIWYLHGGTTKHGRKSNAGHLLIWESIIYFKKHGYTVFDMEGIYDPRFHKHTKKWKGFTQFKQSFGGEVISFPPPYFKFFNRPLHKLAKTFHIKV